MSCHSEEAPAGPFRPVKEYRKNRYRGCAACSGLRFTTRVGIALILAPWSRPPCLTPLVWQAQVIANQRDAIRTLEHLRLGNGKMASYKRRLK